MTTSPRISSTPALVRALLALVIALIAFSAASASAEARDPGPRLTAPATTLNAALRCPQRVAGKPVLLVHGTTSNPEVAWSAGFQPLLTKRGFTVCTVTLPEAATGKIDIASEYVVASIRTMETRFNRPVDVVGHSQGGMIPRWALKWWPDIRSLVGDVIGLAPSNHGSPQTSAFCAMACPASFWQQSPDSRFLKALNDGDETPGRVSYSVVYSQTDETVPPPSPLIRGEADDTNTAVQAICAGRQVSHTELLYDSVAVALVLDALKSDGPARASRIPTRVCDRKIADGIDPKNVERQDQAATKFSVASFLAAKQLAAEPPLPGYATRPAPAPRATLQIQPRGTGPNTRVDFRALGAAGKERWPLPNARITAGGRQASTDSQGRATLRLALGKTPVKVRLVAPGVEPLTSTVRGSG